MRWEAAVAADLILQGGFRGQQVEQPPQAAGQHLLVRRTAVDLFAATLAPPR